jgi:signal transduction histidine kinase
MQIERFDGTRAFVINSAAPILDANGEIVGSAVAILDVTDRIEAEQSLRELNETLEQRVAERTAVAEQRAQHLRELAAELSQAEHRERTRLAAILHDDLQQLLLAARLRLAGVGRGNEATLRTEIKAVDELLGECLRTSRDLTMDLSPPILHHGALCEVFEWLGGWFNEKHGLTVTVDAQEKLPSVPEHIRIVLFHAVRELLFNAVKHSGRMEAWVSLSSQEGCLTVQIEDSGSGFDPKVVQWNLNRARSFGLFNIQERIEALEGRLEVESTPSGGACFRLIVPLPAIVEPLCEQSSRSPKPTAPRGGSVRQRF